MTTTPAASAVTSLFCPMAIPTVAAIIAGASLIPKRLGPEHPEVATSLNNLALLYHSQGQYAKAEPLYQRTLAIYEKAPGPKHPT
jgi:tetratricopeptide (TPR) repeat protein